MGLTAVFVKQVAKPGRYGDGKGGGVPGLYLVVRRDGTKSWVLRYRFAGKQHDMGLGGAREVGLAEARELARAARKRRRHGGDPIETRRKARDERARAAAGAGKRTFRAMAEALIEAKRPGWANAKLGKLWAATFEQYVFPHIGDMDVTAVDTDPVLRCLEPIWTEKPETASRVRQRIEATISYAVARGIRPRGHNPATLKGHLDQLLAKRNKARTVRHHRAIPWQEMPAFWAALAKREGMAGRALQFTILCAARSGETRGVTWGEIDLEAQTWTVPGSRMKGGDAHKVPLSAAAVELLGKPGEPDAIVFPGTKGQSLSDMALSQLLRRMKVDGVPHGFRASSRHGPTRRRRMPTRRSSWLSPTRSATASSKPIGVAMRWRSAASSSRTGPPISPAPGICRGPRARAEAAAGMTH